MFSSPTVQMFKCSNVLLFKCLPVLLFSSYPILLSSYSPVLLFSCSSDLLFSCSSDLLFSCLPTFVFSCSPVLLFSLMTSCPPVFLSSYSSVLSCSCTPVLLFSCYLVLRFSCSPDLPSSYSPVLLSPCHHILLSSCPPVCINRASPSAGEDQLRLKKYKMWIFISSLDAKPYWTKSLSGDPLFIIKNAPFSFIIFIKLESAFLISSMNSHSLTPPPPVKPHCFKKPKTSPFPPPFRRIPSNHIETSASSPWFQDPQKIVPKICVNCNSRAIRTVKKYIFIIFKSIRGFLCQEVKFYVKVFFDFSSFYMIIRNILRDKFSPFTKNIRIL